MQQEIFKKLPAVKQALEQILRFTTLGDMQPKEIFYKEAEEAPKFRITIEVMTEWDKV